MKMLACLLIDEEEIAKKTVRFSCLRAVACPHCRAALCVVFETPWGMLGALIS